MNRFEQPFSLKKKDDKRSKVGAAIGAAAVLAGSVSAAEGVPEKALQDMPEADISEHEQVVTGESRDAQLREAFGEKVGDLLDGQSEKQEMMPQEQEDQEEASILSRVERGDDQLFSIEGAEAIDWQDISPEMQQELSQVIRNSRDNNLIGKYKRDSIGILVGALGEEKLSTILDMLVEVSPGYYTDPNGSEGEKDRAKILEAYQYTSFNVPFNGKAKDLNDSFANLVVIGERMDEFKEISLLLRAEGYHRGIPLKGDLGLFIDRMKDREQRTAYRSFEGMDDPYGLSSGFLSNNARFSDPDVLPSERLEMFQMYLQEKVDNGDEGIASKASALLSSMEDTR